MPNSTQQKTSPTLFAIGSMTVLPEFSQEEKFVAHGPLPLQSNLKESKPKFTVLVLFVNHFSSERAFMELMLPPLKLFSTPIVMLQLASSISELTILNVLPLVTSVLLLLETMIVKY